MKLPLLLIGCIFSNFSFSQQLKPEIKELMGRTEINTPSSLVNADNNHRQNMHPPASIRIGPRDTLPEGSIENILKNWQKFDFKVPLLRNSPVTALQKKVNPKIPGIYHLPQDNMVCIVPDTKDISPIPNCFNGSVTVPYRSKIPNPAIPKILRDTK